jgi:hypothetical protein
MAFRKLGLLALLLLITMPVMAQERFGGLSGVVTDSTKAPVPGVTITVTNKQTGAIRTAVSGADGTYQIPDLTPGRYTVNIELQGFQKVTNDDVIVLVGKTFNADAELKPGAVTEVVNVTGESRQVDLKSVVIAHNVTAEEIDRLPKTRTFQGIALTSPGVNSGDLEGGFQVHGASGAENAYTVDGVTTNSLLYGSSRQNTVFEYIQEVQVKTAGIDAQYGGALGGVISAVTKSGGNVFHGEGHYYYFGNGISAGPVQRLVLSPLDDTTVTFVQDDKQKFNNSEPGASVGGPIVKDHLFFYGSYSPRIVRRTNDYGFSLGAETGSIAQKQTQTQAFGKLTYSSGGRVQANFSALLTPTRSTGTLPAYDGTSSTFLSSSLAGNSIQPGRGFKTDQNTFSGDLDVWLGTSNYVSFRGGYFHDNYVDTGIPSTTSVLWNQPSIGLAGVPASLQQPKNFQNTPRAQITDLDTTNTGFFQVDYNHQFNGGGTHFLKGGVGVRHTVNDVNLFYPGGYVLLNWNASFRSGATGLTNRGTYGYYEVNDRLTTGAVNANMPSVYVQDTWTIANRLTLNLGVRTEKETIPSFRTDIKDNAFAFGWADKIAPRLGASYDVLGNGRLKAFGSWGRYFDWVKYELARGSYGGDKWHVFYRGLDTLDVFSLNLNNMPGADLWGSASGFRDRRVPNFDSTDPNIKAMYQDATNAGIEYQINPTTVFGATYVHNKLTRTIEDLGGIVNGDEVYVIGNPGEGLGAITPSATLAPDFPTPKPLRQYDALELTLSRRFSQNWFTSANLTISRLYGNYAGVGKSDEITTPTTGTSSTTAQQQSGSIARPGTSVGRDWDVDEILWDSHGNLDVVGRLATDRPVVAKLYGAYNFKFGTQIGFFEYVGSGTPLSTYVITINQVPVFVNGRGDLGRTPVLSRTDLLVSHELGLMGSKKLRLELNVQNLFNQKTATHIFNYVNKGAGLARGDAAIDLSGIDLRQGYDYNALVRNGTSSGASSFDPRYGMADLWQQGTQGQVSVKFIF